MVHTAVVMKGSNFWDITLRSPLKVNQYFKEDVASILMVKA
jgi:hypothetical protein